MLVALPSSATLAFIPCWTEKGLDDIVSFDVQTRKSGKYLPVHLPIESHILLGRLFGAPLQQVHHVVMAQILHCKRW